MEISLIELAFKFLSEQDQPCSFSDIWNYVVSEAKLSEEDAKRKIGTFYTNLMIDGRIVTIGDNKWDLRTRQKFERYHIDTGSAYEETTEADVDPEDLEDKEYESALKEDDENSDEDQEENSSYNGEETL